MKSRIKRTDERPKWARRYDTLAARRLTSFRRAVIRIVRHRLEPLSFQSVSQWAEANRYLPPTASEPGRYRSSRCPYQIGIMDAFNSPGIKELTIMAAERTGKSTVLSNILGFIIDRRPSGVLWVMPNQLAMTDFVRDEVEPMVNASVRLRRKVGVGLYREGSNSVRRKTFQNGFVTFVGGGSPTNIAFRTVKVCVVDEVDKLKNLPREGDADLLVSKRVSTFTTDGVVIRASKPSVEGSSRIDRHFRRGTMSRYYHACPACGQYQVLRWGLLHFDDATMRCEACGTRHDQDAWLGSIGEWRESVPNIAHKSFHLSCLVSPFIRWTTLIEEFRAANEALESGDVSLMQVFVNSRLGECFGGVNENRLDPNTLYSRREYFGPHDVPEGVVGLTLGADTQDDRLIWLLSGWGRRNEVWQLATGEIMGDMSSDDPWNELDGLLDRLWYDKDGNGYRPLVSCLDVQGQHYQRAVAFVKARSWKRLRGVRGLGLDKRKSTSGALSVIRNVYRDKTLGVPVQNLDVDCGKTMISVLLSRTEKGPGCVHLPAGPAGEEVRGFTLDVCSEFTAEYRKKTVVNGYPVYSWHKYYGRANHRLDCFCYSLAAALLSKVKFDSAEPQRIKAADVGEYLKRLEPKPESGTAASESRPPMRYGAINPHTGEPYRPPPPNEGVRWGVQKGTMLPPDLDLPQW